MSKIKLFTITTILLCVFDLCCIISYADDNYIVGFRYYPRYSVNGQDYTGLGYYSESAIDYYANDWTNLHSYTINTSNNINVGIYTMIDRYNDFTFSVQGKIEQNNPDISTFKIINMNVYYEYYPEHILTEGQIEGTLLTYIDDLYFTKGYTQVLFEGKDRTTGEWKVLQNYQLHKNSVTQFTWNGTDDNPSWQYSAYRINFSLWGWEFDGLTLIGSGQSSGQINLCSCDFFAKETNSWEDKVSDLVDLQNSTISEIKNVADLVKSIPDLLLDGLYSLFVPDDLDGTMEDYIDNLLDSMGILGFPFELALYQIQAISNYNPNPVINIPKADFNGYTVIQAQQFDMSTIGNMYISTFDMLLINIVRMCTSLLLIYSIANISKSILYDLGIIKDKNDDVGGGNI